MKKLFLILATALFVVASFAQGSATKQGPSKFTVTSTGECGYNANYDFKISNWQKSNTDKSTVTINWEKKMIEMLENGYTQEGPYFIVSVGEEYLDASNRPTLKLVAAESIGGGNDEEMAAEFVLVATEGKSIKEMTQGYLYQIFFEDVFAYELKR